ncbi:hypothetical protein DACRYDRAFT_94898 [Dacryopinax primogenitus]|uniref:Uncharacterized protein n=1 Tax=Dacryopinax primogenitus (strain DJM 731) TaxID=1858805 RepID=M5GCS0_DACPD|nr:uncharacterized protein DACRYDRAFT_94898 [Dacryopinax primogenitus]EJU01938.1 hypothetical protein DACRYDRAFT_94898 [Dacryopinax primogenitus]
MFDEYVEHSGNAVPAAGVVHRAALSTIAYEGFDGEYGVDSNVAGLSATALLSLGRVQYTPPSPILSVAASPSTLLLLLYPSTLLPIDLQHPEDLYPLSLAPPPKQGQKEFVASRVFCDPEGRHVLATSEAGDNYYFYNGAQEPGKRRSRPLKSLKGQITAACFPRSSASSSSVGRPQVREVLLGVSSGQLLSVTLDPSADSILSTIDRHVTPLFQLPEKVAISGLQAEFYSDKARRCGAVVVSTGGRVYQFYGPLGAGAGTGTGAGATGGGWEEIFKAYREGAPKFLELPPPHPSSSLHFLYPSPPSTASAASSQSQLPTRLAWLTSSGIYTSLLTFPPLSGSQGPIDSARLLPFPEATSGTPDAEPELPIGLAMTEWHYVLLYPSHLVGISLLSEKKVWEEHLPLLPREAVLGLAPDVGRHTAWVYTAQNLWELDTVGEARDVWRDYLGQGKWDEALKHCTTPEQRDAVHAQQADHLFNSGRYIPAAHTYALAPLSRSFESVTLHFIDSGERDALRFYLSARLERTRKADVAQRCLLATWMVEGWLARLGEVEDGVASFGREGEEGGEESHGLGDASAAAVGGLGVDHSHQQITVQARMDGAAKEKEGEGETKRGSTGELENLLMERHLLEDELKQFLITYKANLDKKTTYELILAHGRADIFLHYASIVGDWERVLDHWVLEEDWEKALAVLSRQSKMDLYYRHASVLIRRAPKETVDLWLRAPQLDPLKLVAALLQAPTAASSQVNHAIRYLHHLVFERGNADPKIHNLFITFLATLSSPTGGAKTNGTTTNGVNGATGAVLGTADDPTPAELLRFLTAAPAEPVTGTPYYDLDYALRLCKSRGLTGACVLIYSQMGLYENAVELALERGDVELARINADKPEEDERLRKKLWLKIAKYVVQDKKDIRTAMQFVESTNLLSLEDILPFFPDFVLIDDFKDTIISALESSSAHIERLKSEMEDATRSAESIRAEITQLKDRFVTVERNERCARCGFGLLARQFYVFPCGHSFHTDCLIAQGTEYLPPHALRRILGLQNQLLQLTQPGSTTPIPGLPGANGPAQRALLSAAFNPQNLNLGQVSKLANPLALGSAGKKFLTTAGEGLRDLIVPESLASAIGAWGGSGTGRRRRVSTEDEAGQGEEEKKIERLREELDDLIAAECPLCEGVVAGLDKAFVEPGEVDESWAL